MLSWLLTLLALVIAPIAAQSKPNIVFILTDDQDVALGSLEPMEKTISLIGDQGARLENAFVTTPICCPSRSSILTGLYIHSHGAVNNSQAGGCSNPRWQNLYEPRTFGRRLHDAGYRTFYTGKYLNEYGFPAAGGPQHIPPGWDWWAALVGNSIYYNYNLSVNGTAEHHANADADYLPDVLRDKAINFLNQSYVTNGEQPFLMVIATPTPHDPYTPARRHAGTFDGLKAPRTPNFNIPATDRKHWLMRQTPEILPDNPAKSNKQYLIASEEGGLRTFYRGLPLEANFAEAVLKVSGRGQKTERLNFHVLLQSVVNNADAIYRHRWEALLAVDELVEAVVNKLNETGVLDNTYVIFTSDHGFHYGQFGYPWGKLLPYEFDIRVPMLVRGPNIAPNTVIHDPVLSIDFAPTMMEMGGVDFQNETDGSSFLSKLVNPPSDTFDRTFLVEYRGQFNLNDHCWGDPYTFECRVEAACKCRDMRNNSYVCVRHLSNYQNDIYCRFEDTEDFAELYDINEDPHELENLARPNLQRDITKYEEQLACYDKKTYAKESVLDCLK